MTQQFQLAAESSPAQVFQQTNQGLEDFKKDLDQDFYILDHVPELLSQMAKTGQPAQIKINGKEEEVSFYMIYQAMQSFSNLKTQYTRVLGAEHLDKDVTELNKALKTALSSYNDLKVPIGGGQYKTLQYVDPNTGKLSNANAWELLQNWKGGKDDECFYVKIDADETTQNQLQKQHWVGNCGGLGDSACHNGNHYETGHEAPDAKHPEDNRYISITKHLDGCGDVTSWTCHMTAGQVASSLQYDSTNPNFKGGENIFNSFFAKQDW